VNPELEKAECSLNKEGLIQTGFNKEKIRKIVMEIRLNDNQVGKIVQKLKGFVERIEIELSMHVMLRDPPRCPQSSPQTILS
jgi:hypothetical protein